MCLLTIHCLRKNISNPVFYLARKRKNPKFKLYIHTRFPPTPDTFYVQDHTVSFCIHLLRFTPFTNRVRKLCNLKGALQVAQGRSGEFSQYSDWTVRIYKCLLKHFLRRLNPPAIVTTGKNMKKFP
jgi:hypothetical protein